MQELKQSQPQQVPNKHQQENKAKADALLRQMLSSLQYSQATVVVKKING